MKKLSRYDKMFYLLCGVVVILILSLVYQIRQMNAYDMLEEICDDQDKLITPQQPVVLTGVGEYTVRCSKNISNLYEQSYPQEKWWLK